MIGFGNRFRLSGELKERNMRFAILSGFEFDSKGDRRWQGFDD
jgi:hypothetical protein